MALETIRGEQFPPGKPQARTPMFVRVVTGISTHFEARFIEWAMAASIAVWGWNLRYVEPESFAKSEAWVVLNRVAGQEFWSASGIIIGTCWLVALTINGTFAGTLYSKVSPYVRGLAAFFAALFWFHVFSSVVSGATSGRGAYWLHLGLSLWCLFHTWRDVGRGTRNVGN